MQDSLTHLTINSATLFIMDLLNSALREFSKQEFQAEGAFLCFFRVGGRKLQVTTFAGMQQCTSYIHIHTHILKMSLIKMKDH